MPCRALSLYISPLKLVHIVIQWDKQLKKIINVSSVLNVSITFCSLKYNYQFTLVSTFRWLDHSIFRKTIFSLQIWTRYPTLIIVTVHKPPAYKHLSVQIRQVILGRKVIFRIIIKIAFISKGLPVSVFSMTCTTWPSLRLVSFLPSLT